jgi:hypothetical protein
MAKKRERGGASPKVPTLELVKCNPEATLISQDSPPPQRDSVGGSRPEDSVGGLHYDSLYREGREALDRINIGRDFTDWFKVAPALDAARTEAMKTAGVNETIGAIYNKAFGEILKRERLWTDKLDSATRNNLFTLYKHRSLIEEWRAKLTPGERSRWNHPSSVLRNWGKTEEGRAALRKPNPPAPGDKGKTVTERLNEQVEQNEQLQARLEEVEQERDQYKREATAGFIEPAAAFTTLVSMGNSLQLKDLPKEVKASDLRDLAERIGQLAAEAERLANEETVH